VVLYIVHALNCASRITVINGQIYCDKCSKSMGKRGSEHVESLDDIVLSACDTSIIKEPRIVSVKVEDSG